MSKPCLLFFSLICLSYQVGFGLSKYVENEEEPSTSMIYARERGKSYYCTFGSDKTITAQHDGGIQLDCFRRFQHMVFYLPNGQRMYPFLFDGTPGGFVLNCTKSINNGHLIEPCNGLIHTNCPVQCDAGYAPIDDSVTCTLAQPFNNVSAVWSHPEPCRLQRCPDKVSHGQLKDPCGPVVHATCGITCDPEYSPVVDKVTCNPPKSPNASEEWSPSNPCTPKNQSAKGTNINLVGFLVACGLLVILTAICWRQKVRNRRPKKHSRSSSITTSTSGQDVVTTPNLNSGRLKPSSIQTPGHGGRDYNNLRHSLSMTSIEPNPPPIVPKPPNGGGKLPTIEALSEIYFDKFPSHLPDEGEQSQFLEAASCNGAESKQSQVAPLPPKTRGNIGKKENYSSISKKSLGCDEKDVKTPLLPLDHRDVFQVLNITKSPEVSFGFQDHPSLSEAEPSHFSSDVSSLGRESKDFHIESSLSDMHKKYHSGDLQASQGEPSQLSEDISFGVESECCNISLMPLKDDNGQESARFLHYSFDSTAANLDRLDAAPTSTSESEKPLCSEGASGAKREQLNTSLEPPKKSSERCKTNVHCLFKRSLSQVEELLGEMEPSLDKRPETTLQGYVLQTAQQTERLGYHSFRHFENMMSKYKQPHVFFAIDILHEMAAHGDTVPDLLDYFEHKNPILVQLVLKLHSCEKCRKRYNYKTIPQL